MKMILSTKMPERLKAILVCLLLAVSTLAVFWQVHEHDFVNLDDWLYVKNNPHVQGGLTGRGLLWAFSSGRAANWHPLTWLSHMLDCELFGNNPGRHHLVNVFFHIANTILLFLVLKAMTGALWQPAFVAAVFAIHPLHCRVGGLDKRTQGRSEYLVLAADYGCLPTVHEARRHRLVRADVCGFCTGPHGQADAGDPAVRIIVT
jgi:hypothetical protein